MQEMQSLLQGAHWIENSPVEDASVIVDKVDI
jgi:hypothetical protein